jgi:predicted component of type VI protein secretion system
MPLKLPSLLDRLTDSIPTSDWGIVEMLENNIKRDLEFLLNSRKLDSCFHDLTPYPEVETSVLNYGIDEYAGLIRNDVNIYKVTEMVREAVLLFEPRIIPETLQVIADCNQEESQKVFSDLPKELKQKIYEKGAFEFIIRGTICLTKAPIDFHTQMNLSTGHIEII